MSALAVLPDLDEAWAGMEVLPEYVVAWSPPWLFARRGLRRPFPHGLWELLTVTDFQEGRPASPGWQQEGPEDVYPIFLAAWAKNLLGYPVDLEPGWAEYRLEGLFSRWQRVTLYWVRRNS